MHAVSRLLLLLSILGVLTTSATALAEPDVTPETKEASESSADEEFTGPFIDDEDGWVDVSEWLGGKAGFLPAPILITEPAVGYGGGLALVYFHDEFDARNRKAGSATRGAPSTSGVFGGGTQNKTWFAGGFHNGHWFEDKIRYLGVGFYGDVKLDYFGQPGTPAADGVLLNLKPAVLLQEIKFRIPNTPLFIGPNYTLLRTETSFEALPDSRLDTEETFLESGAGLKAELDLRDNPFTPNSGLFATAEGQWFSEALGGDNTFYTGQIRAFPFWHVFDPLVLGFRADWDFATDSTPFFMKPFINMRGIPAMRYQGNHAVMLEIEPRWTVYKRLGLVGIAGAGVAALDVADLLDEPIRWSFGGGVRYLLAKVYGMNTGIDVARGPETWAFYLVFGNGWRI